MLFKSLFFISTLFTALAAAAAAPEVLPPAAPWHGNSERLALAANDRWATPAEQTNFQRSPDYAQTTDYVRSVVGASDLLSLHSFGTSVQGRALYYVLAKKPGANKPVVVVQGGIHAGEIGRAHV